MNPRESLHARSCTYFDVLHRLELDGDLEGDLGECWLDHLSVCSHCRTRALDDKNVLEACAAGPALADSRHEEILATVLAADPLLIDVDDWEIPHRTPPASGQNRWAVSLFLAASLVGILFGWGLRWLGESTPSPELAAVRQAVHHLRQQVTLAQLRDPSAARRVSAVLEVQRESLESDVLLAAVLWSLQYDPSVNVRLTAVRVLAGQLDRSEVAPEILASFDRSSDPLVRLAMVDAFAEVGSMASQDLLLALRDSPNLESVVREHAAATLSSTPAS